MPIIPGPPPDPTILLNYGQSVDEASLINGIQNKETIQLKVKGEPIPLSTSAIAENWVRVVFKQDNINYTYETGKGWYTYTSRSDLIVKLGNLSEEVKEKIDSAKELPSGGNEGDVLTMGTNNKPEWADDNEEFEISISFDGDGAWSLHTIGEDILNAYKAGKKLYSRVRLLYTGEIIGRAEVTSVMENPDGRHYYFYFTPINWGSGDEWVVPVVYIHTNNDVDWGQALYLSLIGLPGVTQSDGGKFLGVDSNGVWNVVNSPYQEFIIGVSLGNNDNFIVDTPAATIVDAVEAGKRCRIRFNFIAQFLFDIAIIRHQQNGDIDISTAPFAWEGSWKGFQVALVKENNIWTATATIYNP